MYMYIYNYIIDYIVIFCVNTITHVYMYVHICACVGVYIYMKLHIYICNNCIFSNFQNAWQLKIKTYEYNTAISFTELREDWSYEVRLLGLNAGFTV